MRSEELETVALSTTMTWGCEPQHQTTKIVLPLIKKHSSQTPTLAHRAHPAPRGAHPYFSTWRLTKKTATRTSKMEDPR